MSCAGGTGLGIELQLHACTSQVDGVLTAASVIPAGMSFTLEMYAIFDPELEFYLLLTTYYLLPTTCYLLLTKVRDIRARAPLRCVLCEG